MSFQLRVFVQVVLSITTFALLSAEQVYTVTGVVRGKLLDGRPVIEHEEIPGYMMAMTMAFNVADLAEVADLIEGDKVRFQFHVDDASSFADQFVVTGQELNSKVQQVVSGGIKPVEVGDPVPAFSLVDEQGELFANKNLLKQFTLMTFIFTRCPVPEFCPLLATKFQQLQAGIQKANYSTPVRLTSVTLDPVFDTSEVLAMYGERVGANPSVWNFATGEEKEILKLARIFQVISKWNNGSLDHTLTTALIGPNGTVLKLWPGNRWQSDQVLSFIQESMESVCYSGEACEK